MVLQLHKTPKGEENNEENFDPKLVAAVKQEKLRKFEKLKVYEIANEEEFKRDPKAIKIGTNWVVTNKGTKTKPMIKACLVGKEFADETKKRGLLARTPRLPALRYSVTKLATNGCSEERTCVGVMDVNQFFF